MTTMQRIIEIPLFEVQTEKARNMDITISNYCAVCGKKIKDGTKSKEVQLLTNGNIISTDQDVENTQGFFPVGAECLKKLVINFAF
jgi:hypothetical protein